VRALLLLVVAAALLPLLSAQPYGALLVVVPSAGSLNLSAGEVAALSFVVQNVGGEDAVNVTVTLVAGGCAKLLGWNGTWVSTLVAELGSIAPGSAKRLVVPVRCQGGEGSVIATAQADNTDPAFASVKLSAKSGENSSSPLILLPLVAVLLVALTYALARSRRDKSVRRRAAQHGSRKGTRRKLQE
jgi:hypothetical protein